MYKIIGADGREYGPVNVEQLRRWFNEGRVNAQTRVLAGDDANWKTLAELPEFALAPGRPTSPQPIRPLTGPGATTRPPQLNAFALTGLILGVFSLVISFCCCGGMPFNLLGIVLSGIGLAQINQRPDVYTGKGAAIAGLIVSAMSLLLGIAALILSATLNWDEISRELNKL
jgi:hypothetical protein